ncbi:hypothetical protein SAMN05421638_1998 [Kaistella treverensis]|uniref:Uncharacterized protein n=1 Tax=Kaistella treverensis TaxID=631455 RepID=A0A1I3NBX5_9FLAO|nr:hypothetical protein [Kaistella treverensis]SFJ06712.1 hypothetical protein SAMN05421638_1998 [Kaistella treverensis]
MKKILPFFLLFFCAYLQAQNKEFWLVDVQTEKKSVVKDSAAAVNFLDSLAQNNFYFTKIINVKKEANHTEIYFDKGTNYNEAFVTLSPEIWQDLQLKNQFFTKNLDSLKKEFSENYRKKGYIFNRVKSKFRGMENGFPAVEISVLKNSQRKVDKIVLKGYENVPSRFVKNLENDYVGKVYDEKILSDLNRSLQNHEFFTLEKPPQTLFTKDSTDIYLFLQKKKSNNFDGVIGFGNDKSEKFTFNGSLNLNLRNIFNAFETVNIFWQRNPDKGQTFDLQTDVPYLFKSNIGADFKVNIFRQDSTYATVKLTPAFYLNFKNNHKIGVRGTFETSTVIDSTYVQGKDFNKNGIGLWYQFQEPTDVDLFLYKSRLRLEADYVSAKYGDEKLAGAQAHFFISVERNFHLKDNHYLNFNAEGAFLNSKNGFATNELLRFGGWNSFRGFNEKSLFADLYYYGTAEYRYLVGNQAFFDVFGQYGEFQNRSLNLKPKIYSFGLGFNFVLPIGLMSFQISNGNQFGNPIKFSDTKIHWGVLSRF